MPRYRGHSCLRGSHRQECLCYLGRLNKKGALGGRPWVGMEWRWRRSAVENVLGQEGGHRDVGQVNDVADAQIHGYAANYVSLLGGPPTFL